MADSDAEKETVQKNYKLFLMQTLPDIEEYASSSDEEDVIAMSSLTKSVDESTTSVVKRLPGINEKWNSDADSVEDDNGSEENGQTGDERESFNENRRNLDDNETAYTSDSGSEALWGDGNFTDDNNNGEQNAPYEVEENEESFGSVADNLPTFKKVGVLRRQAPSVKVSSFVSINSVTGKQIEEEEPVFTATEDTELSPILAPSSYSASSQRSNADDSITGSTAATVRITEPSTKSSSKKTVTSTTRSARSSSSKSAYYLDPPPSTSKIITRRNKAELHEDDIGDNLDIYATFKKKQKK